MTLWTHSHVCVHASVPRLILTMTEQLTAVSIWSPCQKWEQSCQVWSVNFISEQSEHWKMSGGGEETEQMNVPTHTAHMQKKKKAIWSFNKSQFQWSQRLWWKSYETKHEWCYGQQRNISTLINQPIKRYIKNKQLYADLGPSMSSLTALPVCRMTGAAAIAEQQIPYFKRWWHHRLLEEAHSGLYPRQTSNGVGSDQAAVTH